MSTSFERAKVRLDNIKAIEPLLSALRTMSMGAWQMANRKIANLSVYEDNLDQILSIILPHVIQKPARGQYSKATQVSNVDAIILIIGSERGLCGKFNVSLAENALRFIDQNGFDTHQIWVMGSRLLLEFERRGVSVAWRKALPASGLTSYQDAYSLTQGWLEQFEAFAFNQFIILHNQIAKGSPHQFVKRNLLPFEFQRISSRQAATNDPWPPPIIETDPKSIYRQIIQHFFTTSFFQALLLSAAAEHSARYHLMQEASENAQEIIEDLVHVLNAERKRKITQQMQELAVSAGLLDN